MLELVITKDEKDEEQDQWRRKTKGRAFQAALMAYVRADGLWDSGDTLKSWRPIFAVLAGTDTELAPVLANLRGGKVAEVHDPKTRQQTYGREKPQRIEFLRSAGLRWTRQRVSAQEQVCTIFHPSLFTVDPGVPSDEAVRFVSMPSSRWCADQAAALQGQPAQLDALVDHMRFLGVSVTAERLVERLPHAIHAMQCLANRTPKPLMADLRFHLQVYETLVAQSFFRGPSEPRPEYDKPKTWQVVGYGVETMHYVPPLGCLIRHEQLDKVLTAEAARYAEIMNWQDRRVFRPGVALPVAAAA